MPHQSRSVFFGYSPERYERRNPRELGFEDRQGYDQGRLPACAINKDNRVVELHAGETTTSGSLNLRIAAVEGVSLNWFGDGQTLAETGQNPSIALSDDDDVIIMYDKDSKLHYRLGSLNIDTSGQHHVYDVQFVTAHPDTEFPNQTASTDPSVALSTTGVVVEMHVRSGGELYWRRGRLASHVLTWNDEDHKLRSTSAAGQNPSVAVNDHGKAVAVFQRGPLLYYTVGNFAAAGPETDPITWTEPTQFHQLGGGDRPSVALTSDNEVIIVFHASANLIQAFGRLGNDNKITFAEPLLPDRSFYVYDKGATPQVATNGWVAVQVFNQGS
ncbi:MAG: hypothetical protein JWO56_1665, partial [Acidobacteria bacterium]|nr:hypothetical protein [Acidobacteriota bacterium]